MEQKTFYISTPIYYATAKPHIGSLYSTLLADVIARWKKQHQRSVYFLTGTDEHGNKVATQAQAAGMQPKDFVDQHIPEYKKMWHSYRIEYSHFIRTTDKIHIQTVQAIVNKLLAQGDIYEGLYHGWYCTPCETFVTQSHQETGTETIVCPSCNRTTELLEEKSYFFAVSKYQTKLQEWYKDNPHWIIPHERAHEIISFLEQPLHDLSISRANVTWGIPFPLDPKQTLYVWIEALCNYITALEYNQSTNTFAHNGWPADIHVMGKDIIRFHGIYWPILLMALNLPLPQNLLVHGWIKVGGQKMSKSLGNAIDPEHLLNHYDPDIIRYALIRYVPVNQDSEFSYELINRVYESDLANDLGNLLQRLIILAHSNQYNQVNPTAAWSVDSIVLQQKAEAAAHQIELLWNDYQLHLVYATLWTYIKDINSYFHAMAPWQQIKTNRKEFEETISATCHAIAFIAWYLLPLMPHISSQILHAIGFSTETIEATIALLRQGIWQSHFELHQIPILFPKQITHKDKIMKQQDTTTVPDNQYATLENLAHCRIVVGTIIACVPVLKSEKLFELTVNCGTFGNRKILTNIRQYYDAQALIEQQALFMLNLKPRSLMGTVSEGMILCASNENSKPILIQPITNVPSGTLIQ